MAVSKRISRTELFYLIAELYGQRATCPRANVGAVAVRDGRVVAAGYNGAPAGHAHCYDVGCDLRYERKVVVDDPNLNLIDHCVRSVHAEANLISWAAREGVSLKGTELYITHTPCGHCAKLLINAGVKAVHIREDYGHEGGVALLYQSRVQVFRGN